MEFSPVETTYQFVIFPMANLLETMSQLVTNWDIVLKHHKALVYVIYAYSKMVTLIF